MSREQPFGSRDRVVRRAIVNDDDLELRLWGKVWATTELSVSSIHGLAFHAGITDADA